MRRILWVFAMTGYCVWATAVFGQEDLQPRPIVQLPAPSPSVDVYAGVQQESGTCENCTASCGHDSCRCRRRCEAARYRSDIPKGHCEAICMSLREIGDITLDVPYSFYEWCKKIKNTVLDRGTCRNRGCSY